MKPPPTLLQYREQQARLRSAEYGVSIAEARYGIESLDSEWRAETEAFAQDGGVFRKAWLNACGPDWRYMLIKHWPGSIPAGYVNPECR